MLAAIAMYAYIVAALVSVTGVVLLMWLLTLGARAIARKVSDNDA